MKRGLLDLLYRHELEHRLFLYRNPNYVGPTCDEEEIQECERYLNENLSNI